MALRLDSRSPDFETAFATLLAAKREVSEDVDTAVRGIIKEVRADGDAALVRLSQKFDRVDLAALGLRVTPEEIATAVKACRAEDLDALRLAHERIHAFHVKQVPEDLRFTDPLGVELGWRWSAIQAVGLYVPGGTGELSLLGADERRAGQGGRLRAPRHGRARRRTGGSTRWCWPPPTSPASMKSIASAGRRRSPPWPMGRKRSRPS